MSYLRPVRLSELTDWLVENEVWNLTALEVAQLLVDRFDVLTYAKDPV